MRNPRVCSLVAFWFFLISRAVFAAGNGGLGDFADSMIAPVGMVSSLITTGAMLIGLTCLFGALLRYSQYRINPLASPLSTVIVLVILGVILICLPLLNIVFKNNIPFLNR